MIKPDGMEVDTDHNIMFLFEPETLADVLLAVYHNPVEVSGLAQVSAENDSLYVVKGEPEIFDQECGWAFTDFDIKAYQDWRSKMLKEKRFREFTDMRVWWHSHIWGLAYFSIIDVRTIISLGRGFDEWWVSLVLNKYGEFKLWLNVYRPERRHFEIEKWSFTRQVKEEEFRSIMLERSERIKRILAERVRLIQEKPYEPMLSGIFRQLKKEDKSFWDPEPL